MARQPGSAAGPDVVGLAFRLGVAMRREFSERMAGERWAHEANLRPGCFGVLRTVDAGDGPLSQRDVAARTGIDPSDVVDLVDRLEAAGLLRRERDRADRRRHALVVTDAGHDALARFRAVAAAVDAAVLAPLDAAERYQLADLLRRVVGEPAATEPPGRAPPGTMARWPSGSTSSTPRGTTSQPR